METKYSTKTLLNLFEAASSCFSDKCAVISNEGDNKISCASYLEVYEESVKICTLIEELRSQASRKDKIIGLCMEQSLCIPAIILGILKSGTAFACLDPNKSQNQLTLMNINWVFTKSNSRPQFMNTFRAPDLLLKTMQVHGTTVELWEIFCPQNERLLNCISNLAYAITTSGTTGTPKLIQVPHNCIVPNIKHLRDILDVQHGDIIPLASPLTFDPSIVEMFLALSSGASLLIVSNMIKASPRLLLEVLFPKSSTYYSGVTILQCTPSILSRWAQKEIKDIVLGPSSTLRALVLGGEPCPDLNIINQWRSTDSKTDIYNIYGITEVSCWASISKVVDFDNKIKSVPLGTPLSETLIEVRNKCGDEVNEGIGEVFIGSRSRFCVLDEEKGDIAQGVVYRATGDLVNVDATAKTMTYIGRKDSVIKRWGHRVSLSQIEQAAGQQNNVESCCCVWDKTSSKITLFIKNKASRDNDRIERELRSCLARNVPLSSMPDQFRFISTIPLTHHGKIDKRQLLSKLSMELKMEEKTPDNCEEGNTLLKLWVKCLNLSSYDFDRENSFLSLGGNSLIALQLTRELENAGLNIFSELLTMLLKGATYNEYVSHVNSKSSNVSNDTNHLDNMNGSKNKRAKLSLIGEAKSGLNYQFASTSMCRGKHFYSKHEDGVPLPENLYSSTFNDIENINFQVEWRFDLGKCIDASPLFIELKSDRGLIAIGSHSHRLAILDIATGVLAAPICLLDDRIESSACVSLCGTKIFVGCYDGNMHCVDVTTGETVWQYQAAGMIKCTPALCSDGTALTFGAYDSVLYCLRIEDGSMIWKVQPGHGSIYSSPCVSLRHQLIYSACLDGTSCAVHEGDGSVAWCVKMDTPIFSSPGLICDDHQVVFAEVRGLVHGLSSTLGDKLWTYKAGGQIFSSVCTPVISGYGPLVLFGCHDNHVYCLEQSHTDGITVKWKTELDSPAFATPFAFPIQTVSYNPTFFTVIASTKGWIYLIDLKNGLIKCLYSLDSEVYSSPIVYKNHIILGCRDNNVYSLKLLEKSYKPN